MKSSKIFGLIIFGISIAGIATSQYVFNLHLFVVVLVFIAFMGMLSLMQVSYLPTVNSCHGNDQHSWNFSVVFRKSLKAFTTLKVETVKNHLKVAWTVFQYQNLKILTFFVKERAAKENKGYDTMDKKTLAGKDSKWVNNYVPYGDYPKTSGDDYVKDQVHHWS